MGLLGLVRRCLPGHLLLAAGQVVDKFVRKGQTYPIFPTFLTILF